MCWTHSFGLQATVVLESSFEGFHKRQSGFLSVRLVVVLGMLLTLFELHGVLIERLNVIGWGEAERVCFNSDDRRSGLV